MNNKWKEHLDLMKERQKIQMQEREHYSRTYTVEAMGKVVKSNIAKREQAAAKKAAEAAAVTGTTEQKTTV